jgi:signal transduction histidine kinase
MKMRLLTKTTVLLGSLIVVVVVGVSGALIYSWHHKQVMDELISGNVADMLSAAELDISLLQQRGYVASYIMSNGDKKWLEDIALLQPLFRARLENAKKAAETEDDRAMFARIEQAYDTYVSNRDTVVALYDRNNQVAARQVYLDGMTSSYQEVRTLCDEIVAMNKTDIVNAFVESRNAIQRFTYIMAGSVVLTGLLGAGLVWVVFRGIFIPIRRLTEDVREFSAGDKDSKVRSGDDDLDTLRIYLRTLMSGLHEARTDLEKSRSELLHSERLAAIGNAVAHIAHEVKNPLMTIGGFAKLIEKKPQDVEKTKEFAEIISKESSRLERMLFEVMEFSRPVNSKRKIQSLNRIVKDAMNTHSNQVPEGISVDLDLDPSTPDVLVDAGPMEQIILNLVRNSVEAIGSNGKISIMTRPLEGGAMLVVQDNGPGIPDDIKAQVFEPFFTTKKKGHGLGLAICRQIVTEQGGAIHIDSAPGKGTTFTIKI